MSIYKNGDKILNSITAVEEEKVKEIVNERTVLRDTDLDTVLEEGKYYVGSNCTNAPIAGGYLDVRRFNDDFIAQILVHYSVSQSQTVYVRTKSTAFGKWVRLTGTKADNVAVTNVTDTLVSGNATGGTLSYYVKDGICYVELDAVVINSASSGGSLSSFTFPIPYANRRSGYKTIQSWKGNNVIQLSVMSNGKLAYWCETGAIGNTFYGQFSYPVAE